MRDCHNNYVDIFEIIPLAQMYSVFFERLIRFREGIMNQDLDAILSQFMNNVRHLAVAQIRHILFKREA